MLHSDSAPSAMGRLRIPEADPPAMPDIVARTLCIGRDCSRTLAYAHAAVGPAPTSTSLRLQPDICAIVYLHAHVAAHISTPSSAQTCRMPALQHSGTPSLDRRPAASIPGQDRPRAIDFVDTGAMHALHVCYRCGRLTGTPHDSGAAYSESGGAVLTRRSRTGGQTRLL